MVFCNIGGRAVKLGKFMSHNPYFNRWFSAIQNKKNDSDFVEVVTILILIDGFLQ